MRHSDGALGWVLRTLDFGTLGYDPVVFAEWQCFLSVFSFCSRRASDHNPVEVRFQRRSRPKRRTQNGRNALILKWFPKTVYSLMSGPTLFAFGETVGRKGFRL